MVKKMPCGMRQRKLKGSGKTKKSKIVISGDKKYTGYLSKHLRKEHPSTRKRMRVY